MLLKNVTFKLETPSPASQVCVQLTCTESRLIAAIAAVIIVIAELVQLHAFAVCARELGHRTLGHRPVRARFGRRIAGRCHGHTDERADDQPDAHGQCGRLDGCHPHRRRHRVSSSTSMHRRSWVGWLWMAVLMTVMMMILLAATSALLSTVTNYSN